MKIKIILVLIMILQFLPISAGNLTGNFNSIEIGALRTHYLCVSLGLDSQGSKRLKKRIKKLSCTPSYKNLGFLAANFANYLYLLKKYNNENLTLIAFEYFRYSQIAGQLITPPSLEQSRKEEISKLSRQRNFREIGKLATELALLKQQKSVSDIDSSNYFRKVKLLLAQSNLNKDPYIRFTMQMALHHVLNTQSANSS